ncbi:Type I Iterative PKS [Amphichorda felina]
MDSRSTPNGSNGRLCPSYEPIAITGIGVKLPESRFNIDSYHGGDDQPASAKPLGGHFLQEDIRDFDNQFFGIHNREASDMDPQQRKLLEVVFESFENAGVTLDDVSGANVGCYVASFTTDFIGMQTKDVESLTRFSLSGMGTTILANRISHTFNLKGPSCVLDTACSASLYALHAGCAALQSGECDSAVVAGVNLIQSLELHVAGSQAGVLSRSSTCHTFDASADGYARADGINAVYIKRLDDAIRDGDPIRSVIRSTAVNSNGRTTGITKPSIEGQEAVIRKAYSRAALHPSETAYVEAHGTGTNVGDATEVEALSRVFLKSERDRPSLIGSVKTNLGHSEAASGLTSIIKATLALERGHIPATIGVQRLNEKIKADEWGVEVVTKPIPFPSRDGDPRRISINSFGYGGANAHGILEGVDSTNNKKAFIGSSEELKMSGATFPVKRHDNSHHEEGFIRHAREDDLPSIQTRLLPFSATKLPSLNGRVEGLRKLDLTSVSLPDLAYTLGQRRTHLPVRGYIITRDDTLAQDINVDNLRVSSADISLSESRFAFVFTGQGAQWAGMARELMQFIPFSRTIHQLDEVLSKLSPAPDWSIYDVLMDTSEAYPMNRAQFAQPVTTAVQVAIVDLLRDWSIIPEATLGHSSGEIGAAYGANLLSAREAIVIAYFRGYAASQGTTVGAMAAVGLGPEPVNHLITNLDLNGKVRVACINSPESVTVSGDSSGVEIVFEALKAEGVFVRKLKTDGRAYHSHHMAAVGQMYEKLLEGAFSGQGRRCPSTSSRQARMFSTVTCVEVREEHVRTPWYWRSNLESPVRFSEGLECLSGAHPDLAFIEIGPHSALKMPVRQTLGKETPYFATLDRGRDSSVSLLSLVGDLYTRGLRVDFAALGRSYVNPGPAPKVLCDLPPYPWHYENLLWNESRVSREGRFRRHPRHELLGSEVPGGNKSTFGWRNMLQLDHVPWLRDHKLGDTAIFPATGYMAMAVEALMQTLPAGASPPPASTSIILRHVDLLAALPLVEGGSVELYTELRPLSLSNVSISKDWWEFQISSIADDAETLRAKGSVRFESRLPTSGLPSRLPDVSMAPHSKRAWYKSVSKCGFGIGPAFELVDEIYTPDPKGTMYAEARTKWSAADVQGAQPNPRYMIHPTVLDSLLQVSLLAVAGGLLNSLVAKVPTRIGQARISLPPAADGHGLICCTSKTVGMSSSRINSAMLDSQQQVVAHLHDVDVTTYAGTDVKTEMRHPLFRVSWKPDVDKILTDAALTLALDRILSMTQLGAFGTHAYMLAALDLVAHKTSDTNILCLSSDSVLIDTALTEVFAATSHHRRFHNFSLGRLTGDGKLEVAELRSFATPLTLESLTYTKASSADKYGLVILPESLSTLGQLGHNTTSDTIYLRPARSNIGVDSLTEDSSVITSSSERSQSVQLIKTSPSPADHVLPSISSTSIIHVCGSSEHEIAAADTRLTEELSLGWGVPVQEMALQDLATQSIPAGSLVISTIELEKSVLACANTEEFTAVQHIIEQAARIVWLTGSGVHQDFDPTLSLFPGLSRAIMVEQPSTKIFTLELDPRADAASIAHDVVTILNQASRPVVDYEYIKDSHGFLISRTVPDERMNTHFRERKSTTAKLMPLANAGMASLSLQKPGQLNTAQFVQKAPHDFSALSADDVLIKVHCVGLNAKDVYALAGRVHTTEASCSFEYAGQVVAVGSCVDKLAPGDRVAVLYPGHFSTYELVPSWSCVKLREGEDMRTMASVLVVFLTALYALHHRARLQPGESILIHSAAGGVGIATIQMAKLIGAEIYATVGTEEKKQYLVDSFGLNEDRIFNSHDVSFASDIKAATGGRGVDVILNSLVGDLLHESWECLADLGRFVEIGKRDITDGGRLNMEMLSRSTTFTAFDLSLLTELKSPIYHNLCREMISQVMELLRSSQIEPIKPLSVFAASELPSALSYFRNSKRMGKIVISLEDQAQLVPVVPSKFSTTLDSNKSYLLVGCLGGLGRSISKWMMSRGARQFVFIGRTGTQRPAARRLVDSLEHAGAHCVVVMGDVTNYDDVERAIKASPSPLGGVIQAAMGLNEAIFKYMSHDFWTSGTEAKVRGTWNLHNALSKLGCEAHLDFFLMTSSISGKVGTATEGNYCAANNFLDVFARYRRGLGLKAISIGLGMISEVGYLHENPHIEDLLLRKGVRPITEDELLQILDMGLSQPPTSAHPGDLLSHPHILTGLEVTGLEDHHRQGYEGYWQFLNDARFSVLTCALKRSIAGETTQGPTSQSSAITAAVAAKDGDALVSAVRDVLAKKMSNLILLPVANLDVKKSLTDFGMDSMLAAELRQFIFSATGVDVLFLTIMDAQTNILSLAKVITEKLLD